MQPIIIRTLRREYRITTPSPSVAATLAFASAEPEIVGASLELVDLAVGPVHGFFRLALPGGGDAVGTVRHIVDQLDRAILQATMRELPGSPFVAAASVLGPAGRILLIGPSRCGKTTLALHLLSAAFDVEGDAHTGVCDVEVVARPTRLRIAEGSLAFLPRLAPAIRKARFAINAAGTRVYAVDPTLSGRSWRITAGQADHLVFIEANHGGRSVMGWVTPDDAVRRLLETSLMPAEGKAKAAARLRQLALQVPAWRLSLGDLKGAERHIRHLTPLSIAN